MPSEIHPTESDPSATNILVVDDDDSTLKLISLVLHHLGYQAICADSAEVGLQCLEEHPVELIISDIRMPGQDGFSFTEAVHVRWPEIPIILCSVNSDRDTIQKAMQVHAADYVRKPVTMKVLGEKVGRVLEAKRQHAIQEDGKLPLAEAVIRVMQGLFSVKMTQQGAVREVDQVQAGDISTEVDVEGAMTGKVWVCFSRKLAQTLTVLITGTEPVGISQTTRESVRELSVMLVSRSLQATLEEGSRITTTVADVMVGPNQQWHCPIGHSGHALYLESQMGTMWLFFCVKG